MNKDLNVCILNDSFPPVIDGVANTAFNYANILTAKGHKVVVSTPDYPDVVDDYAFDVLRYHSIDTTKLIGYRAGLPYNPNYVSKIMEHQIDILHTHCPVMSTIVARILRNAINKPIIFTYHTKFDVEIRKAVDSHLLQETAIKVLNDNISACDEVWVVSKGAGENMRSLGYQGDYIVMPNGVDFPSGKGDPKLIEDVKKKYDLDPEIPTYLFVGRMYWYKGLRIILDALKIKKDARQLFRMLFVGDGREKGEIEEYAKQIGLADECTFTGPIYDRTYLKAIFSACDLFLFPSTYDTNGLVVKEAASSSLAAVLIKGSCASEDTIDGQNCLWIEENADSLAKILLTSGNDLDYVHQLGEKANQQLYLSWEDAIDNAYKRYEIVSANYNPEKHAKWTLDPNENVLALLANMSKVIAKSRKLNDKVLDSINDIYTKSENRMVEIAYYLAQQNQESIDDYLYKITLQTKDIENKNDK